MSILRMILALARLVFWTMVASPVLGGGPRHPSYAHAVWNAWRARMIVVSWLRGDDDV